MKQCNSPHLVRIGPVELRSVTIGTQDLICFSEELIDGEPIKKLLKPNRPGLSPQDLVQLGFHVADAIEALWKHKKIHRDIKPGNIMRRRNGDFVVLDMGLVFDLNDESWSMGPVGTHIYFSPEQMDFTNRRQVLDFRSDLFSLGITMYQLATGIHPFMGSAQNTWEVLKISRTSNLVRRTHSTRLSLSHSAKSSCACSPNAPPYVTGILPSCVMRYRKHFSREQLSMLLAQIGYGRGQKVYEGLNEGSIKGAILSPKDETRERLEQCVRELHEQDPDAVVMMDPQFYVTTLSMPRDGRLPEYDYYADNAGLSRTQFSLK